MKCQACNTDMSATARFCAHCGAEVGVGRGESNGVWDPGQDVQQQDDRPLAKIGPNLIVLILIIYGAWYLWQQFATQDFFTLYLKVK